MKKIYKYTLDLTDRQWREFSIGAKILTVQIQYGLICVWALVETENPTWNREFFIFGTGQPADRAEFLDYVGTVQQGSYVWHVFTEKD